MSIKINTTYSLENEERQEVLEENSCILALVYYNDEGKKDVITKVVAEEISDTVVEFRHLSDDTMITIPIDKIIDWIC